MYDFYQIISAHLSGGSTRGIARAFSLNRATTKWLWKRFQAGDGIPKQRLGPRSYKQLLDTEEKRCQYSLLLGMYLGDGCLAKTGRKTGEVHTLILVSDETQDLVVRAAESAMMAIFPDNVVSVSPKIGARAYNVKVSSINLVELFPQHGPGLKSKRRLIMKKWQWDIIIKYPWQFVRGLFLTDGSRYVSSADDCAKWSFGNKSPEIINFLRYALNLVGVNYGICNDYQGMFRFWIKKCDVPTMDLMVGHKSTYQALRT